MTQYCGLVRSYRYNFIQFRPLLKQYSCCLLEVVLRVGMGHIMSYHVMSRSRYFQVACINGDGVYPGFMAIYAIFIGKFVHFHGILWGTFSNKFVSTSPPSRLRSGCVKMLFEFLHHSRYSSATNRIRLKFPQTAGNDEASRCSHSRIFMTLLEGFDPPQRYIMIHIYIYIWPTCFVSHIWILTYLQMFHKILKGTS